MELSVSKPLKVLILIEIYNAFKLPFCFSYAFLYMCLSLHVIWEGIWDKSPHDHRRTLQADNEASSKQVEAFLASLGNQLYTADAKKE